MSKKLFFKIIITSKLPNFEKFWANFAKCTTNAHTRNNVSPTQTMNQAIRFLFEYNSQDVINWISTFSDNEPCNPFPVWIQRTRCDQLDIGTISDNQPCNPYPIRIQLTRCDKLDLFWRHCALYVLTFIFYVFRTKNETLIQTVQ